MTSKNHRLTKGRIIAIITAAVVCVLVLALVIVNIFIPIKYLSAYFVIEEEREEGVLTVTFIDVGYGDSTLCELPDGKILLIDGGDGSHQSTLAILRKLNERGVEKIDYLVCTSVLGEYCGGLAEIIQYKEIGKIFMPEISESLTDITDDYAKFVKAAENSDAEISYCHYGNGDVGEDYFFTFLSPSPGGDPMGYYEALNSSPTDENILNASAVIWLEYAGRSFAFTSSAGKAALEDIVESYEMTTAAGDKYGAIGDYSVVLSECDVVSVPGHGREECSSARWYEALSPSVAVISVGENYSGYPSTQALADIGSVVEQTLLTMEHGNISVSVDENGNLDVFCEEE